MSPKKLINVVCGIMGKKILRLRLFIILAMVIQPSFAQWYSEDAAIMGTPVHVEFWFERQKQNKKINPQSLAQLVFEEMRRIDALMSPFKPSSELSKVNRLAGVSPTKISEELFHIIEHSITMSKSTDGAFDISYASVGRYYDYRKRTKPNKKTINALLPAIKYQQIKLNKMRREVFFSHAKLAIDLGGIAKGYAVDRSIDILDKKGIKHAIVSAGGDSRIIGDKRGRPWMVGVRDPRSKGKVSVTLPLSNVSISTSGDYERFFEDQDVRYHHILDPQTGISASKVRSVTVIGPVCMTTDALSTGVFVLGVEKGLELIEAMPDTEVVIIDRKGKLHFSKGLIGRR